MRRKVSSSLSLPPIPIRLPSSVGRSCKFWKKRRSASSPGPSPSTSRASAVAVGDLEPQYRVNYLGNVLTGWAKGE